MLVSYNCPGCGKLSKRADTVTSSDLLPLCDECKEERLRQSNANDARDLQSIERFVMGGAIVLVVCLLLAWLTT